MMRPSSNDPRELQSFSMIPTRVCGIYTTPSRRGTNSASTISEAAAKLHRSMVVDIWDVYLFPAGRSAWIQADHGPECQYGRARQRAPEGPKVDSAPDGRGGGKVGGHGSQDLGCRTSEQV